MSRFWCFCQIFTLQFLTSWHLQKGGFLDIFLEIPPLVNSGKLFTSNIIKFPKTFSLFLLQNYLLTDHVYIGSCSPHFILQLIAKLNSAVSMTCWSGAKVRCPTANYRNHWNVRSCDIFILWKYYFSFFIPSWNSSMSFNFLYYKYKTLVYCYS